MTRLMPCVLAARSWSRSGMRSYSVAEARALHALAESRPTPSEYAAAKAAILGAS